MKGNMIASYIFSLMGSTSIGVGINIITGGFWSGILISIGIFWIVSALVTHKFFKIG